MFVWETSLVLDPQGHPHIAYVDSKGIKYAHWYGSTWRIEVVIVNEGSYVSLGLDSGMHPLISYYTTSFNSGALKLARFDGLTWQIKVVDSGGVGSYSSLKLDPQDRVHISYHAETGFDLRYARGTPQVRLGLGLNQESFRPGETLALSATVTLVEPLVSVPFGFGP